MNNMNCEQNPDLIGGTQMPYPSTVVGGYFPSLSLQQLQQLQVEAGRAEIQRQTRWNATQMEILKKEKQAEFEVKKSEELAKRRSDISAIRELQREEILFNSDGVPILQRELFATDAMEGAVADIYGCKATLLRPIDKQCASVSILRFEFRNRLGEKRVIFLDLQRATGKYILSKLRGEGVSLRASGKKQQFIAEQLIGSLIGRAKTAHVPTKRGFYEIDGGVYYANDESMYWEEVLWYAGK